MLNILSAIVTGLIVGVLARFFYPGAVDMGWIATCLLGIGGAVVASLVTTRGRSAAGFSNAGFVASVLGGMALIFLFDILN